MWNLDIMKGQGTGKMCSLQRGSLTYIEALCHIALYFTITQELKKIVHKTKDFVTEVPL